MTENGQKFEYFWSIRPNLAVHFFVRIKVSHLSNDREIVPHCHFRCDRMPAVTGLPTSIGSTGVSETFSVGGISLMIPKSNKKLCKFFLENNTKQLKLTYASDTNIVSELKTLK